MNKWLAVMALGAAMAAAGCESDGNGTDTSDPKKMSLNANSACKTECHTADKTAAAAEPKKLSAGAKAECQTQCPIAAKAK